MPSTRPAEMPYNEPMKILVIEDDVEIQSLVEDA